MAWTGQTQSVGMRSASSDKHALDATSGGSQKSVEPWLARFARGRLVFPKHETASFSGRRFFVKYTGTGAVDLASFLVHFQQKVASCLGDRFVRLGGPSFPSPPESVTVWGACCQEPGGDTVLGLYVELPDRVRWSSVATVLALHEGDRVIQAELFNGSAATGRPVSSMHLYRAFSDLWPQSSRRELWDASPPQVLREVDLHRGDPGVAGFVTQSLRGDDARLPWASVTGFGHCVQRTIRTADGGWEVT